MANVQDAVESMGEPNDLYLQLGRSTSAREGFMAGENTQLIDAGKMFFNNLSRDAYNLICGNDANAGQVKQLMSQGVTSLAAGIAVLLAPHLAIPIAALTIVATLIVRLFFDASEQTLCTKWKEQLPVAG